MRKISVSVIERQSISLEKQLAHYTKIKDKLYEDYVSELLTKDEYLEYSQLYGRKIEEIEKSLHETKCKIFEA